MVLNDFHNNSKEPKALLFSSPRHDAGSMGGEKKLPNFTYELLVSHVLFFLLFFFFDGLFAAVFQEFDIEHFECFSSQLSFRVNADVEFRFVLHLCSAILCSFMFSSFLFFESKREKNNQIHI